MIAPGSRIGGLLIEGLLGRGAMGEVYQAVQVSLKRPVAVKRIAGHLVDNPDMVARFEREAQCIARIQSTNVVAVYEFGQFADEQGAKHFLLVMELVEGGRSLKSYMHGAMDWRLASSVILQAAEGLAAAADHGVVHRDIKPDNLMITKKGVAKLTDFGLAKAVDSTSMTMGGTIMGTPAYMPPEACRGEATDHRGDLYSLGATWYHLLSGQVPFRSENTMAMLRAHIEEPPPDILALFPSVPEPIADLVRRCLAKDPAQRPASAQQLANELQALVGQGLHIKRTVPELVGGEAAPTGDPSTIATLVDGGKAAGTALTLAPGAKPATPTSTPTIRPSTAGHGAATITNAPDTGSRVSPWLFIVPVVAIAVLAYGLVWAIQHLRGDRGAPISTPVAVASGAGTPGQAQPTAPTLPPTPPAPVLPAKAPAGDAAPAVPPPVAVPPAPTAPTVTDGGHLPVITPRPVVEPAGLPPAPIASPSPVVASQPAPPAIASPSPVVALPPAPAALPPPPVLTPPAAPKRPATAAADVDAAVAQFRTAMRTKRPLAAEAVLSSIPGDAVGYKDMVRNLGTLKSAQDAAFAALGSAAASGRAAELAAAAARAAEFPELAPAVAQSHAYVGTVELQWAAALKRVDEALARHDAVAARAALAEVPTDPAMVTPIVAAKRNAAATAVAALQDPK